MRIYPKPVPYRHYLVVFYNDGCSPYGGFLKEDISADISLCDLLSLLGSEWRCSHNSAPSGVLVFVNFVDVPPP